MKVVSLREQLLGEFRMATMILLSAVGVLLLVACVNVANLLLARGDREKEISVRRALGASDGMLIRQWMTEAAMLAALGGFRGPSRRLGSTDSYDAEPGGAARDCQGRGRRAGAGVRAGFDGDGVRAVRAGSGDRRFAGKLDAARIEPAAARGGDADCGEVALAVILLVGAGLLLRSFEQLSHVDPGFTADHLLTMRVPAPATLAATGSAAGHFSPN